MTTFPSVEMPRYANQVGKISGSTAWAAASDATSVGRELLRAWNAAARYLEVAAVASRCLRCNTM